MTQRSRIQSSSMFSQILAACPDNIPALINRAYSRAQSGDIEGSREDAITVLALIEQRDDIPRDGLKTLVYQAKAYRQLEQYDKAMEKLRLAIKLYPEFGYVRAILRRTRKEALQRAQERAAAATAASVRPSASILQFIRQ